MTDVQVARLGELSTAITITKGFPTQRTVTGGDVRVMSVAAVRNAIIPRHFADQDSLAETGVDFARPGDVLVAIEGGTVGEVLVVPDGIEQFVPSQQAATLRVVDTQRVDPWYLGAWLTTEPAAEQLRRLARGQGIQRIPIKELSSLILRLPRLRDQHEIGRRFLAFEAAIRAHRAVSACLEELRDLDLAVTFADDDRDSHAPGNPPTIPHVR
jgi:hypothetical protein